MRFLLLLLLLLPLRTPAQFMAPASSPAAVTTTTVGYTELTVNYHRPAVRGRDIFGGLIPYGKIWRAGANATTVLRIDNQIEIEGVKVDPGSYRILVIPRRDSAWTWIINDGDTEAWGARNYDPNLDVVRYEAYPRRLPARVESLEYRWLNLRAAAVDLVLEWEWFRISLPLRLNTDEEIAARAARDLSPAKDPNDYYAIARYYLDQGKLRQAKAWIDRWAAQAPEQFGRLRYQAIIEHELGNDRKGERLMKRSLELAREAGNDHYVRMNEKSLRDWQRDEVKLPADSIIARSIRYHDPAGNWVAGPHRILLAESRPGGVAYRTSLELYPASDEFSLTQNRNADLLEMGYRGGRFERRYQNETITDEARAQQLGLTEKRLLQMRDYYTYLYGLPMKLTDDGTTVGPTAHRVWFDGRELLEVEVSYAPETGKDVWRFYFDPETYALSGYAFYHAADGPGTGEYILLEDEARIGELRLPAKRHWYTTQDRRYLGTDTILNGEETR